MKKNYIKSNFIGFIIGAFVFGSISVFAITYFPSSSTTYDNSSSGMNSTNVQDALDELYNVCDVMTSEDLIVGLEKDPYECRYFFTGKNPNNYITFNNEQAGWRIIFIGCDGTIKIMRINIIRNILWDDSGGIYDHGNNNWSRPSTLNTYLNGTYYNNLTNVAKSQIVSSNYSIGSVVNNNNNLQEQVNDENSKTWNGKVALPTLSEYLRTNSDKNNCGTFFSNNNNSLKCTATTWMIRNSDGAAWWTLSPNTNTTDATFLVNYSGSIYNDYVKQPYLAHTVVTLSSKLTLSGSGTQSDPYTIN